VRGFCVQLALLLLLAAAAPARAQTAALPEGQAAALLDELHHAGLDAPRTFKVTDLYLQRDAVRLHLQHGTLVFLQPVAGRVTGAVFEGAGEILVVPPEPAERQQLLKFTGSPLLTESFASLYLRFSDRTGEELRAQIRAGHGEPAYEPDLFERWEPLLAPLNRAHSLRLLLDYMDEPVPYFYAGVEGRRLGTFNVVVDDRRPEQILVGQVRGREERAYYDVWSSFTRRTGPAATPRVRALAYRLRATLLPTTELEADCEVDLELGAERPRTLLFELSRFLSVSEVSEVKMTGPSTALGASETPRPDSGQAPAPLEYFQNAALTAEEARYRGTDVVAVVLPPGRAAEAERRTLRFRYRGRVIADLGNGVLFVGARGNWYPNINVLAPARFELRFRFPRTLQLVATGTRREQREEGEWKEALWVSELRLPVAGFNVGDYETRVVERDGVRVTAYANRQLEPRLAQAARQRTLPPPLIPHGDPWARLRQEPGSPPPAPPTMLLERVANDVANSLATYTELFGRFPYAELHVSQIPGGFGQGYPGLIYLSTLSFLPAADQARLGLSERAREAFSLLTPAHEVAHQWWGNSVRLPHYRDQWLAESLAGYSALLYVEKQAGGEEVLREWLDRYRADLLETDEAGNSIEATGALTLGVRLDSSRSPDGYVRLIYSKGPWILHMLREMFRDPATGSDAVFCGVLRRLAARGGQDPLTTAEFQRALEAALPPQADAEKTGRLDWFFGEWVYDTGFPRYRLRWELGGRGPDDRRIEGAIEQSDVSELFTMPVPVYARYGTELRWLGTVVVTGREAAFAFPVSAPPDAVLLDPYHSVLRRSE